MSTTFPSRIGVELVLSRSRRVSLQDCTSASRGRSENKQDRRSKVPQEVRSDRSTVRRPGSGRPTKITPEVLQIVEDQMQSDGETNAVQLQSLLVARGHLLCLNTTLHSQNILGWTFCGSAYCQIIRDANKEKRQLWARQQLVSALTNGFQDVRPYLFFVAETCAAGRGA